MPSVSVSARCTRTGVTTARTIAGVSTGTGTTAIYVNRNAWDSARKKVFGRYGRLRLSNIHATRWSWLGPDTDVNDATRLLAAGRARYSHTETEPQSWASTCTGRSGLTASTTAAKSSARRAIVYSVYCLGDDDGPTPRLS